MPKKGKKRVRDPKLQYLGKWIKAARNKNHLTQQELADQAGVGLRHYQNIENGLINPSYKVLLYRQTSYSTPIFLSGKQNNSSYLANSQFARGRRDNSF